MAALAISNAETFYVEENIPFDLTHDALIFLIQKDRPELVHGQDFWVGQKVLGDQRISPAFIMRWDVEDAAPPTQEKLDALALQYESDWTAITNTPTQEMFEEAIQTLLDEAAQARRYTSGDTLATYVDSTNSEWVAEAKAFVAWRDAVWLYAYAQLDAVLAGEREQPTIAELVAELPTANWPDET
nr:hypothetical protein [uncultured Cohaesibacter sp.]